MKKISAALLLFTALIAPVSAADKPIDVEEYASIEALAAAIVSHVPGTQGVGKGLPKAAVKKTRLAIIPVKISRTDMVSELARQLAALNRFDVLEAEKVAAFLRDKQQSGPSLIRDVGKAFDLDEVIAVRAYPSDGKLLIIARIFHTAGSNPPITFVALLSSGPKAVAAGGEAGPLVASAGDKGVNAPDLPLAARYFALAGLDGDGKTEYVFSDGERLHIYRLESSTWLKVWIQSPAEAGEGKHLYLDAADVNGNGRPEIFVTFLRNSKALSVVYEERNGTYRPIAEMPVFLRILHYPGRGPVLIGQEFDEKRFFGKATKQYSWSGDKYAAVGDFPLPKDVNLYGFVVAEFGEAHPLIVALSEKNHLRVYSRETLVWESQERYGGTETAAVESSADIYNVEQKVSIKGRMFAVDIDGDGKDELIIPRNTGATVFTTAKESEVYAMEWTGARLEQKAAIRQAPGAVLDLQMVRQTGGGARIAALVATKGGAFSKPGSRLITYSLK
ncbi:MAG: FG-GAP-like repeat-containing protein [Nitrospirota bacterium]